ncbi:hypothetical protein BpHYR1_045125 [Brachionus plicatilis]|uniref:RNA-directed DNA polymerase from mobile element jockey-like n=1 Tax=Brachionus plicatilis TaxID=10195 RepID=A0A3M7PI90_BRAPC|nr:hypothetical protein BpHYR1_045125 [Brachionus plicatilis]
MNEEDLNHPSIDNTTLIFISRYNIQINKYLIKSPKTLVVRPILKLKYDTPSNIMHQEAEVYLEESRKKNFRKMMTFGDRKILSLKNLIRKTPSYANNLIVKIVDLVKNWGAFNGKNHFKCLTAMKANCFLLEKKNRNPFLKGPLGPPSNTH